MTKMSPFMFFSFLNNILTHRCFLKYPETENGNVYKYFSRFIRKTKIFQQIPTIQTHRGKIFAEKKIYNEYFIITKMLSWL